jgi:chromosome segregation ATPase
MTATEQAPAGRDLERVRLAWKSAARRAKRREPHEREGLIFHLERENALLHSFVQVANAAATASHTARAESSAEVVRLREEIGRLRAERAKQRRQMAKPPAEVTPFDAASAEPAALRSRVAELEAAVQEMSGHRAYWHREVRCADARISELERSIGRNSQAGDC